MISQKWVEIDLPPFSLSDFPHIYTLRLSLDPVDFVKRLKHQAFITENVNLRQQVHAIVVASNTHKYPKQQKEQVNLKMSITKPTTQKDIFPNRLETSTVTYLD